MSVCETSKASPVKVALPTGMSAIVPCQVELASVRSLVIGVGILLPRRSRPPCSRRSSRPRSALQSGPGPTPDSPCLASWKTLLESFRQATSTRAPLHTEAREERETEKRQNRVRQILLGCVRGGSGRTGVRTSGYTGTICPRGTVRSRAVGRTDEGVAPEGEIREARTDSTGGACEPARAITLLSLRSARRERP